MLQIKTGSKKDVLIHLGIMLSLVSIVVLGFFFIYLPSTTHHGESIPVPELSGKHIHEVEKYLGEYNLRYEISDSTFILDKPASIVLTQYPKAGERVKENRKIYITVTTSIPPHVEMPKLVDISLKSAELLLQSNQLRLGESKRIPHLAQNLVLKQEWNGKEVAPGTKIPKGSIIHLTVGDGVGSNTLPVPDLVGMSYSEAEIVIKGSNLIIGRILPAGITPDATSKVVKQNPGSSEGKSIREGEQIDIWLEKKMDN
ncbi:PASTA domain-containing protein [Rhodocytophaga rosea]|uniref:PASTA domain-containing protein n=1 Tax=Rhodocytophaga rosea TaxID=2704465 RepID=A0A6C0GG18_9BACT|nr:PASTA domain-containing protein [Rhodocytophaga rosea]QHT66815.1 PASTA domain-containing protein [Rhodocytophaga rosea]